jgi:hypothetical protein
MDNLRFFLIMINQVRQGGVQGKNMTRVTESQGHASD